MPKGTSNVLTLSTLFESPLDTQGRFWLEEKQENQKRNSRRRRLAKRLQKRRAFQKRFVYAKRKRKTVNFEEGLFD